VVLGHDILPAPQNVESTAFRKEDRVDVRTAGAEIAAFLDAPRYGVIATHAPDGSVWQAVVWYAVTDDGILMNARDGRRWVTNLQRDARTSLVVADGEDYVIVRGEAVVTDDPGRGQAEALSLARRYRSDDTFAGQRRVSILLHVEGLGVHGRLRREDQAS
jgi:PPOX class probable F420-dependent enzyme